MPSMKNTIYARSKLYKKESEKQWMKIMSAFPVLSSVISNSLTYMNFWLFTIPKAVECRIIICGFIWTNISINTFYNSETQKYTAWIYEVIFKYLCTSI